jgi:hypothetical protein
MCIFRGEVIALSNLTWDIENEGRFFCRLGAGSTIDASHKNTLQGLNDKLDGESMGKPRPMVQRDM